MKLQNLQGRFFGEVETHGLEHRCYDGICLFAGIGCILAGLFNTLIGIYWLITAITLAIGVTCLLLYVRSRRHPHFQPHYGIIWTISAMLLATTWFWNGGLGGSDLMVAMVVLVALITVADRTPYRFVGLILIPLMSLLFLIEYLAPSLVKPYASRGERFIDLYMTFLVATFVIYQIIAMILKAHRDEKSRADAMNRRLRENVEALQQANQDLENALAEVKTLSGLLPICASCQKIRNDKGYWDRIETYIQAHTEATFSHSLCPDCARKLYPDLYKDREPENGTSPNHRQAGNEPNPE